MGLGNIESSPFKNMFTVKDAVTRRSSSWDTTGANHDFWGIEPGETVTLMETDGPGCVSHFYFTTIAMDRLDLRRGVLRMYWDGEDTPSVEVPLGDFFGAGNCIVPVYASQMMVINKGFGSSFGFNCYFPMPFNNGAKITLTNDSDKKFSNGAFWFHIEYEQYTQELPDDVGRFHAQFRRENLTKSVTEEKKNQCLWEGQNLDGDENYVILEAEGQGQFVGMLLNVDNVATGWWGEGDDMIFVDGEPFPPRYHGTGSEEVFGGGACPNRPYFGPYTGFSSVQNLDFHRNNTMYRWYVHDPIRFKKSIKVSIEHGHCNNMENDYSSVAYWYQTKPAAAFPALPSVEDRMPIPQPEADEFTEAAKKLGQAWEKGFSGISQEEAATIRTETAVAQEDYYMGNFKKAIAAINKYMPQIEKVIAE